MTKQRYLKILVISTLILIVVSMVNILLYNIKAVEYISFSDRNLLSYLYYIKIYLLWIPGRILFLSNIFITIIVIFELIYLHERCLVNAPLYKKQSTVFINCNKKRKLSKKIYVKHKKGQ